MSDLTNGLTVAPVVIAGLIGAGLAGVIGFAAGQSVHRDSRRGASDDPQDIHAHVLCQDSRLGCWSDAPRSLGSTT